MDYDEKKMIARLVLILSILKIHPVLVSDY